ncbi:ankyrin repeat and zinc finger domain-containing protein 1-like isoform X2 [Mytilus californianus]|nr:ankyrin repeat and zinc finger domain-containing protein 1-like isoform X2 [Mytilus californianus]
MDSTTTSPKKLQKKRTQQYSMCFLYNTGEAIAKLTGLTVATCNPSTEKGKATEETKETTVQQRPDFTTVSEKMSCNYCVVDFESRGEQRRHYKSDWHRYNLRQRLKGVNYVNEDKFEELSGNISSISGSESDSDDDDNHATSKPVSIAARFQRKLEVVGTGSSTDSESEDSTMDDRARKYPKIFLKNSLGDLISLYRCVVCHKQVIPTSHSDLISMVTDTPLNMKWAVLMSSGGHFAGAIYDRDKIIAHKTFHRYVVRAKRGTAQSSRDSQGNAPKSAGAALRRYNEAALQEDVRALLTSWDEHIKSCDLIFLRAPSFNKKIFFSGKAPPLDKKDKRIRMIPFQTKRPTHNEVQRVHQMLASIESYGEEAGIQDFIPLSPQLTFSADVGKLIVVPEDISTSPRHRKSKDRLGTSPLTKQYDDLLTEGLEKSAGDARERGQNVGLIDDRDYVIPPEKGQTKMGLDHLLINESFPNSSGNSTASDSELVVVMQTLKTDHLKEFAMSKKPKRKKNTRKRRPSIKHQLEPGTNPLDEEKYHLKNSLYTACKVGDADTLLNLLAVFNVSDKPDDEGAFRGQGDSKVIGDREVIVSVIDGENVIQETMEGIAKSEGNLKTSGSEIQFNIDIDDMKDQDTNNLTFEPENVFNNEYKVDDSKDKIDRQLTCDDHDLNSTRTENTENVESKSKEQNIDYFNADLSMKQSGLTSASATQMPDIENVFVDSVNEKSNMTLNVKENSRPTSREGSRSRHSSANDMLLVSPIIVTSELLNEPIGDSETTLLMIASKEGHKKLIQMLMKAGSNPAVKDKYGQTAYQITSDKETRNEFRRFMAKFPDRYDYDSGKIPGPLTEEMEAERRKKEAERKKQQKKAKQERDKEKRAEEAIQRVEEEAKKRFLSMPDRDKRALAAEKRLKDQKLSEGIQVVLSRCYQCGKDMTGKVPFEYFDYKFCSPKCLKEHRQKTGKS